ncbi:ATP-binding protein [Acinetobacter sp. S40]|uniref:ATP-binding protein n=1 Tax=Acinetobacter sp. S40 TaxID=2767434 RepID=UPI00190A39D1|nr:ATP-binding protein [Acinetobacter sp. S40]MBJ9986992.1 ATP-binding protein [Acinetobacter sp. S40]
MNTLVNLSKIQFQVTDQLCLIHHEHMTVIGGHLICKSCAKEKVVNAQDQNLAEMQKSLLQQRISNAGLKKRYVDCGFKNFAVINQAQENAVYRCQCFAEQLISGEISNLLLFGSSGTGKTHLSASIIRNILHRSLRSVRYFTSAEIAQKMMDSWSDHSSSEDEIIRQLTSFDLLVIDEYGLHDRHEKPLEMVHKVLYSRYDQMKSTLLISNFPLAQFEKDVGTRLWSRLHENGLMIVPCYWDDFRKGE